MLHQFQTENIFYRMSFLIKDLGLKITFNKYINKIKHVYHKLIKIK